MANYSNIKDAIANSEFEKIGKRITVRNAVIMYKNFSGRKTDFNREGNRNFCLCLTTEAADRLLEEGLNVKERIRDGESSEDSLKYITIKVNLNSEYPPTIATYGTKLDGTKYKKVLTAETLGSLDFASFERVDLTFKLFHTVVLDKARTSAYLDDLRVVLRPSDLYGGYYAEYEEADEALNKIEEDTF